MLVHWNALAPLLLGSVAAQQFADFMYDFDVDYYTPTCKAVLNKTLDCDSALHSIVFNNDEPTAPLLEKLCTTKCKSSLVQAQKNIEKFCPVAENQITFQHGGIATAQDNIHEFLDGFVKLCFKDPSTGKFCLDVMSSWPASENMTSAQNCSDCALGAIQRGLNSEITYNEEIAAQFSILTESCQKTGFDVHSPTHTRFASETSTAATPTKPCDTPYTIQADDTCNGICVSQNVSSYEFTQINGLNLWCDNLPKAGTVLCLPGTCDVYTVKLGDDCFSLLRDFDYAFSPTQFLFWNPTLNHVCSNMKQHVDMQLCVSPPGLGHLKSSAPSPTDGTAITPAPQPTNLANGTNTQCAQYYNVTDGDNCADITVAAGISLKDFYFLNPSLDKKCANLILGESYCIRAIGDIETYSGYTTPFFSKWTTQSTSTNSEPRKTLEWSELEPIASLGPGTWESDRCRFYYKWAETGNKEVNEDFNSCKEIARRYRTTVDTLIEWNPSLAGVSPCIVKKATKYCVYLQDEYRSLESTSQTTADTASASNTIPSPTRTSHTQASTTTVGDKGTPSPAAPEMVSGCKDFYKAGTGDYCYQICQYNKVDQKDFIKWNPSVKSDCSLVQKGYWYCVEY